MRSHVEFLSVFIDYLEILNASWLRELEKFKIKRMYILLRPPTSLS